MPQTTVRSQTVKQLVDILEHPRSHTTKKIREPYVDREEVRKHMRLKWKDPGYVNVEFNKVPVMKTKILNQWEQERIYMAQRSYLKPKGAKPYLYDKESREFPQVSMSCYPQKFQKYLKNVESENQDTMVKGKRAKTEGIQSYNSVKLQTASTKPSFMPTTTTPKFFGMTGGASTMRRGTRSNNFKTLNI